MSGDTLIAVPLGFGLGFLIGLTGIGGGALVAPALYVLLRLSYPDAVTISLIYSALVKIAGAWQHVRQSTVRWRPTLLYGLAGVPGAIAGARIVHWAGAVGERTLPLVMAGVLLIVALLVLTEQEVRRRARWTTPFAADTLTAASVVVVGAWQLLVGLLMGLTSVGSGSLVILSMLYLFRMSVQEVVGSSIVIALIMVLPAALVHATVVPVDWSLLALLLLGSVVGVALGARVTLLLSQRALKWMIVVLIVVAAIATFAKAW
ncbi:MAG: sulfite exporter TauE/SafE family protein [Candidatus Rokuibacteriota bacterium]